MGLELSLAFSCVSDEFLEMFNVVLDTEDLVGLPYRRVDIPLVTSLKILLSVSKSHTYK